MKSMSVGAVLAGLVIACGAETGEERYAAADQALEMAGAELVGEGPCASIEQVASDCPVDIEWRHHGQYVACVAKYFAARVESGDIADDDRIALVAVAAQSSVGFPDAAATAPSLPDEGAAAGAHLPDYTQRFPELCGS